MNREDAIRILRENGFICFPIKRRPTETEQVQKAGDSRYKGQKTLSDYPILDSENWGYIAKEGAGTLTLDLDNKKEYRQFAENMIKDGYWVEESPNGWHIPVKNLTGEIKKVELFDYKIQDKKIIEFQGSNHYTMGVGSVITNPETKEEKNYTNLGTEKIWDARGMDIHRFIDVICENCNVTSERKKDRSSYSHFRDNFEKGVLPGKGASNNYFFQAAIQCNTDGQTEEEAKTRIQKIYDEWTKSPHFSGRPWSNIEAKIKEVYEKDLKIEKGRPKGATHSGLDRDEVVKEIMDDKLLFSDPVSNDLFENKVGFLERINDTLKKELAVKFPSLAKADYDEIIFKLVSRSADMPETNDDLIVFPNGVFSHSNQTLIETEDIADMGFKKYNYLTNDPENFPVEFYRIMFSNIPEREHPRVKAGLKAILRNKLDPKISIIHGASGVGKSTPLTILALVMGDYALIVELEQFLNDKFIKAHIKGKKLLVFQDLPKLWKDWSALKTLTGEQRKTERGFHQDSTTFDNKLKTWASANYLPPIPLEEQDAMARRLSLLHNTRTVPYDEDPNIIENVVKKEGEKIISWILNISEYDCKYIDRQATMREWSEIASPEIEFLKVNYKPSDSESEISVMRIINEFIDKYQLHIEVEQMVKSLKSLGYVVKFNIIKNIEAAPIRINRKNEML